VLSSAKDPQAESSCLLVIAMCSARPMLGARHAVRRVQRTARSTQDRAVARTVAIARNARITCGSARLAIRHAQQVASVGNAPKAPANVKMVATQDSGVTRAINNAQKALSQAASGTMANQQSANRGRTRVCKMEQARVFSVLPHARTDNAIRMAPAVRVASWESSVPGASKNARQLAMVHAMPRRLIRMMAIALLARLVTLEADATKGATILAKNARSTEMRSGLRIACLAQPMRPRSWKMATAIASRVPPGTTRRYALAMTLRTQTGMLSSS